MAKINFTKKPYSEQVRILKDYLNRREQHKGQGEISVKQIVKRFKHNRYYTDKAKFFYFAKLLSSARAEQVRCAKSRAAGL